MQIPVIMYMISIKLIPKSNLLRESVRGRSLQFLSKATCFIFANITLQNMYIIAKNRLYILGDVCSNFANLIPNATIPGVGCAFDHLEMIR